jgi:hypothetical protein
LTPTEFIQLARERNPTLPDANILSLIETDEHFRCAVCEELNKTVAESDRALARHILKLYIESHRGDKWGMSDEIRLSAFLLYKIGNVEDVPLLWKAKEANFDTFCGLDIQLLVGAGVEETLAYLKGLSDKDSLAAAIYITECRDAGDFKYIHGYAEEWDRYFSN